MRLSDLKQKEVINVETCRSLGCISDLEIDCRCGTICAVIVPACTGLFWFPGRENVYRIPWDCIKQIGEDIILVKIEEEKCRLSGS